MQNPFEVFDKRLSNIESILIDIKVNQATKGKPSETSPTFGKIPVLEIFAQKMLSKPTFYSHVKSGKITLYKMGGRSYVDAVEFNNAFRKVKI
jgi:hypothetical protein